MHLQETTDAFAGKAHNYNERQAAAVPAKATKTVMYPTRVTELGSSLQMSHGALPSLPCH
jgi:hypothetical protein